MKTKFLIIALLAATIVKADPSVDAGKAIFTSRCASCHNVNKILVGPALAGVDKRRSLDWIVKFVHSSQTLVKSGDKTAMELFNQFNHIPMPDHPDLKEADIKNIVEYIKSESKTPATVKAPFAKPTHLQTHFQPLTVNDYGFFISYLVLVALLIVGLLFAVEVKSYERNMNKEKSL